MNPNEIRKWILVGALLLEGCFCTQPGDVTGAPTTPPDAQYSLPGVGLGKDVYEWTCFSGSHIVITKNHDEWFCTSAKIEKAPCGVPIGVGMPTTAHDAVERPWPAK